MCASEVCFCVSVPCLYTSNMFVRASDVCVRE